MGKGARKRLQAAAAQSVEVTSWHGGAAGRAVGDDLIRGVEIPGYGDGFVEMSHSDFNDYGPDFVYITSDRGVAHDFAVLHGQTGDPVALYKVVSVGKPDQDPDYLGGISFRCQRARVVAIEPDRIDKSTQLTHAGLKYAT